MTGIFEYKNNKWILVYDENILPSKHCNKCEFKTYCKSYSQEKGFSACGCEFEPESCYIKKYN